MSATKRVLAASKTGDTRFPQTVMAIFNDNLLLVFFYRLQSMCLNETIV